ncbi:hypothetical protein EJB05_48992, partial [Eragrostis curvula]
MQDSMCRKRGHSLFSLKMYSRRDFVGVLVGAAIAVACFLLVPPLSSPPCGLPLVGQEPGIVGGDGTRADQLGTKKLEMAAAASFPGEDKLVELLERAAMEDDKTIIMTFTNEAFSAPGSLMDLFLESFHTGLKTEPLLKHLVIVAVDA